MERFIIKSFLILLLTALLIIILNENILSRQERMNEVQSSTPKISIFLPIYNKEKFLERSIGSLQKQTLKEIEIKKYQVGFIS